MWHFLRLCWRDIWRNRRRSLLVGLVMVFAVAVMVFSIGLGTGAHNQMIHSLTDSFLGHVQVQNSGYHEEPDMEHQIPPEKLARIEAVLPGIEGVIGFAPRLATGGLVSKKVPDPIDENDLDAYRKMTSEGALVVGILPARERGVSDLQDSLVDDAPKARCLRGCRAALAELYATDGHCEEVCATAEEGFAGEACAAAAGKACAGRCPEDDDFCAEEDCVERFADYCEPATFLADADPYPDQPHFGQVVLGAGLANVLDVDVGDRVALTTGTARGRAFASLYRVSGLIKTGSLDINRTFALTHYEKLGPGLELEGAASFVVFAVNDVDAAGEIAEEINERFDGQVEDAVAMGWAELSPELDIFVKIDQGSMLVMLALLIAIIGVILANVVTMSVMERTREYGVRLAMGESHRRLTLGLIVETGLLSLAASLVGAAIGEAITWHYQAKGIDFGMGEFETTGVVLSTIYHTQMTWYGFFLSVGTVVFFAVLGSLYPAWKVRKLKPVEALRFV
jgi:ABC-type lipoprotein release transport system permease subunit